MLGQPKSSIMNSQRSLLTPELEEDKHVVHCHSINRARIVAVHEADN
jgi:hypothetical protein